MSIYSLIKGFQNTGNFGGSKVRQPTGGGRTPTPTQKPNFVNPPSQPPSTKVPNLGNAMPTGGYQPVKRPTPTYNPFMTTGLYTPPPKRPTNPFTNQPTFRPNIDAIATLLADKRPQSTAPERFWGAKANQPMPRDPINFLINRPELVQAQNRQQPNQMDDVQRTQAIQAIQTRLNGFNALMRLLEGLG